MNWQTHHRPGIGAGRTNGFLAPLNPFAFTLPPSAALHNVPSNELLLTATNIPTRGLQPVTVPRDRQRDRLTKSDPQPHAFHLLRHREPIHRRSKTVEIVVDKEAPKRPPSSRRVLPPLAITVATQEISDSDLEVVAEETQPLEGEDESEDSSSSEEDDEFTSGSDEPPSSGMGFVDKSQTSFTSLAEVSFPTVSASADKLFPVTLLQEHALLDHERYTAAVHPSGLSSRVNNIVRAFEIRGLFNKELFQQALNQVVSLHPILSSEFYREQDKLCVRTPHDSFQVTMETPPVSHERPSELVTIARRKLFKIDIKTKQSGPQVVDEATNAPCPLETIDSAVDDRMSIASCSSTDLQPKTRTKEKSVKFQVPKLETQNHVVPQSRVSLSKQDNPPLMRVKLVSRSTQEHILLLSFSRTVSDYWSSCLFIQQLSDAYAKLEKNSKPTLAATRVNAKRREVMAAYDQQQRQLGRGIGRSSRQLPPQPKDTMSRLLQRRALQSSVSNEQFHPVFPPVVHFKQVALREHQLVLIRPREKLWNFWESLITAIIRRRRGPPRIKVVPPLRIPFGLGEITRTLGAARPTTARLRPLTARNRPQTGRSQHFGEISSQESLSGPKRAFHFFKVEEQVGAMFQQSFPEEYLAKIESRELLGLLCVGAYVVLMGRCCRGWGTGNRQVKRVVEDEETGKASQVMDDPLKGYSQGCINSSPVLSRGLERRNRGRLDVGSFLVGVEVSLRQHAPSVTQGLFAPLSNVVALRVDLSSCESFADLVQHIWNNLYAARCHAHFPFSSIAEEVGLVHGLPVQFSYYYPEDVQQLSNPDSFYFMETAIGVEGRALARFGSNCYLNPLNSKLDDNCHMELVMWEGVRGDSIDGGFIFQPGVIRSELVQLLSDQLCQLISVIARNPTASLLSLAADVQSPFPHISRRRRRL